ncbi:MAG TPA: hypothetical protein VNO83_01440 [Pseudonocardia sp.]|nr:hypothetical protein [Pseudonocardia sp.]
MPFVQSRRGQRLGSVGVEWFFSGLLIAVSAGTTGFTGYLLWRVLRSEPGPVDRGGAQ